MFLKLLELIRSNRRKDLSGRISENTSRLLGFGLLSFLVFCVLHQFLFKPYGSATIEITVQADHEGILQLYWLTSAHGFAEAKSVQLAVHPSQQTYTSQLPSLYTISRMRITPRFPVETVVQMQNMTLTQWLYSVKPLTVNKQRFPVADTRDLQLCSPDNQSLCVKVMHDDGYYDIRMGGSKTPFTLLGAALSVVLGYLLYFRTTLHLLYNRRWFARAFAVVVFLYLGWSLAMETQFELTLERDAFYFLTKAFEIRQGNWTPSELQFMGWPIFLSFFLSLFRAESLYEGMVISRCLTVFLTAVAVFPLMGFCRHILSKQFSILFIVVYASWAVRMRNAGDGMTEPLFFLLILACVYAVTTAKDTDYRGWVFGAIAAGLAYYVHAKGVFLLGFLEAMVVLRWRTLKNPVLTALLIPFVFFIVSIPHLYLRHLAFGSSFSYGANSNFFAANREIIWDPHYKGPTFSEYMKTHTWHNLYTRMMDLGFWQVMRAQDMLIHRFWHRAFELAVIFYLLLKRTRELTPSLVLVAVFMAGYSIIWFIYGSGRHMLVVVPFSLVIALWLIQECCKYFPWKWVGQAAVCAALVYALVAAPFPQLRLIQFTGNLYNPDPWSEWAAQNVSGKVGYTEGASLVLSHLPLDKIKTIQPVPIGSYASLDEALSDFKQMHMQYLIITPHTAKVFPYLHDVFAGQQDSRLEQLAYFDDGLFVKYVKIFKIHYQSATL